jgi:hypothetical protein
VIATIVLVALMAHNEEEDKGIFVSVLLPIIVLPLPFHSI